MAKKMTMLLGFVLIFIVGLSFYPMGGLAQEDGIYWQMECTSGRWSVDQNVITCFLSEVVPTDTPTAVPTSTETAQPTDTPQPTLTSTPVVNVPDPSDPLCPTHDDRQWHTLYNSTDDCHYDHAHGMAEPSWFRPLFGSEIADMIWTISYPWQTTDENLYKHAGYVTHAHDFRSEGCPTAGYGDGGVNSYAVQTHGLGIGLAKVSRFHSVAIAAQICGNGTTGHIFTGGHEDYGQLQSPYKEEFVSYPLFPEQLYSFHAPPYIGEGQTIEVWNSAFRGGVTQYVEEHTVGGVAFRVFDPIDFVDPTTRTTGNPVFLPKGGDSSAYQLYTLEIRIPDLNGDGSPITGYFLTDVHGVIDPTCMAVGPDCVPLILVNAVPGFYTFNGTPLGLFNVNDPDTYYDHDIWFCGGVVCDPYSPGAVPSGWIDRSGFGQ